MATFTQIDRAKAWLDKTGLKQTNFPLYQIILVLIDTLRQSQIAINTTAASGGGTGSGITSLSGDVVATGPGAAVATIQPNVVTYAKIQQVSDGQRLLGRALTVGNVEEIELGANLQIVGSTLEITTNGGGSGGGLAHNLLSPTHPDTLPASPIIGDVVRAVGVALGDGEYYSPALRALYEEDFEGIRAGYTFGMNNFSGIGNYGAYAPPPLSFIVPNFEQFWLAWSYVDAILQARIVEDFEGIRAGYNSLVPGQTIPGPGNSGGYSAYPLAFVSIPPPDELVETALWSRLPVGGENEVLTIVDGLPEWAALPDTIYPDESWQSIPFSAGDFTATGGTTPGWTVASGNVRRWQKQFSYNALGVAVGVRYSLYLRDTSVTGSGPTQLLITIPNAIQGRFDIFASLQENVTATTDAYVGYDDAFSTTTLFVNKVGGGTFDTTPGETFISFEISAMLA